MLIDLGDVTAFNRRRTSCKVWDHDGYKPRYMNDRVEIVRFGMKRACRMSVYLSADLPMGLRQTQPQIRKPSRV